MLKKIFRLKGDDLKNFFIEKRKSLKSENFLIFYRPNNLSYPRFSVKPEIKIFKKAVIRNKLKRKIYEIIRKNWGKLVEKKYDFVILLIKRELVEKKIKELEQELLKLLQKIND
ncbi:Ribonuclease P protein component [bacterium HR35]|nr:Ribonuclease P protein component [bacterium HR35]